MRDLAKNIRLPSIDDLFSTEEERQDAKLEKIQILPLSELHPFEGIRFRCATMKKWTRWWTASKNMA